MKTKLITYVSRSAISALFFGPDTDINQTLTRINLYTLKIR